MKRKLFLKKFSLFVLVFSLLGGALTVLGFKGRASTNIAPVPYNVRILHQPSGSGFVAANGTTVNIALANGESSRLIKFISKATDANGNLVAVQTMYQKEGEKYWHSFGTKPAEDPDKHHPSKTLPNACPGDISTGHPTCGSYPNKITAGYSEYGWKTNYKSGVEITNEPISLTPGTWKWRTRASDGSIYSASFSGEYKINVTAAVLAPSPVPEPAQEPVYQEMSTEEEVSYPEDDAEYEGEISDNTIQESTAEDSIPPTDPKSLKGSYNNEESAIILTWDASSDNSGTVLYEIERTIKDGNSWESIGQADINEYSDNEFEIQKIYSYRVRAADEQGNNSGYSNTSDVKTEDIKINLVADEEADIESKDKNISIHFPANASTEDLLVTIEKVDAKKINVTKERKIVSDAYKIFARNKNGDVVKEFKTQVLITLKATNLGSSRMQSVSVGYVNDGSTDVKYLKSVSDAKTKKASILTNHFSLFFLTAEKTSTTAIFLRIILWIFIIVALGGGVYSGYVYLQRKNYRQEHSEDYIYRH